MSLIFNKLLVIFGNSKIKDLTSGFVIINKKFLEPDFEGFTYGEYFIKSCILIQKQKLSFKEIDTCVNQEYMVNQKLELNLIKLIIRGNRIFKNIT